MNTNVRSILSTSIALGLASFAITSALILGVAASATLLSFGLLAVYGLIEIAILSYEQPRLFASRPGASAPAPAAEVIAFPTTARQTLARAA